MAILDMFVSIFEADTKGLEKGYKKADESADDLRKKMADVEKQSEQTTKQLAVLAKRAVGFFAAAAGASKAISSSTEQADLINSMGDTAEAINSNVSELDAFQKAMKDAAISGQDANAALISTFNAANSAAKDAGSQQAQAFRYLGVSIKDADGKIKDSTRLLKEIAGAAEELDEATAKNLFERMGISDPRMQKQLMQGRQALEDSTAAHKRAGVVTKEQLEQARKYRDAQTKLDNAMSRGAKTVMSALLPAITWTIDKFGSLVEWVDKNKFFVVGFFGAIAGVITAVYLPAMISAAAATLAATWPIIAIGAAIGAAAAIIGLLVDDVWNWIEGNDSLLGQLIDEYPIIGVIIDTISSHIKNLIALFMTIAGVAKNAFDFIIEGAAALASGFLSSLDAIHDAFVGTFNFIKSFVTGILDFIFDKVGAVTNTVKKVAGFFGFGGKDESELTQSLSIASEQIQAANSHPLNSVTSETINQSTRSSQENNVSIGELKIETQATDAAGIAGSVRSELAEQLKNMRHETDSGIAR